MSRTYLWDNEILSKVNIISRVNGKVKNKGYSLHDAYVEVAEEINKKLNNAESPLRITYNQVLNRYVYLKNKIAKNSEIVISKEQEERLKAKMAEEQLRANQAVKPKERPVPTAEETENIMKEMQKQSIDYAQQDMRLTAIESKVLKPTDKVEFIKVTDNNYQQVLNKRIQIINKLPNITLWQLIDKQKLISKVDFLIERLTIDNETPGIYDVVQVLANMFYNNKEHTPTPNAIYSQYRAYKGKTFSLEEKEIKENNEVANLIQDTNNLKMQLHNAQAEINLLKAKNNILQNRLNEKQKNDCKLRQLLNIFRFWK